jgi:hypothetical protein
VRPWSFVIQRQSGSDHSCFAAYRATLNGLEGSMFTRLRHFTPVLCPSALCPLPFALCIQDWALSVGRLLEDSAGPRLVVRSLVVW